MRKVTRSNEKQRSYPLKLTKEEYIPDTDHRGVFSTPSIIGCIEKTDFRFLLPVRWTEREN